MNRNMNARNFGLRSRNINLAAKNALTEKGSSYSSIATNGDRFRIFAKWLSDTHKIRDLRWINKSHIEEYGGYISEKVLSGSLAVSTGQNYLSAVNSVLQTARADHKMDINPVKFTGKRTAVCTVSKATTEEEYQRFKYHLSNTEFGRRQIACTELTEHLGLRIKEASLLNTKAAISEARKDGRITVRTGTKGGRKRIIPITTEKQILALSNAAKLQSKARSIIPPDMNWKQWKEKLYKSAEKYGLSGFHGGRHLYCQNRYYCFTGVHPPVVAGIKHGLPHIKHISQQLNISLLEARKIDRKTRSQIAAELGHGRIDVTNVYLG